LAEEGLESMTFLRDRGWSSNIRPLSTTTVYQLYWNNSYWTPTTTQQYIDGTFLRQIYITDVKRDGSDRISNAGTYDPDTKFITVTLSYPEGSSTTTNSISTYITNLDGN
jgi:hypothetical protein